MLPRWARGQRAGSAGKSPELRIQDCGLAEAVAHASVKPAWA